MWTDFKVWMANLVAVSREEEEGQALVEYGLILALVSVVSIVVLGVLGTDVMNTLQAVANAIP